MCNLNKHNMFILLMQYAPTKTIGCSLSDTALLAVANSGARTTASYMSESLLTLAVQGLQLNKPKDLLHPTSLNLPVSERSRK